MATGISPNFTLWSVICLGFTLYSPETSPFASSAVLSASSLLSADAALSVCVGAAVVSSAFWLEVEQPANIAAAKAPTVKK